MAITSKKVDGGRQSLCKEKQMNEAQETSEKSNKKIFFIQSSQFF